MINLINLFLFQYFQNLTLRIAHWFIHFKLPNKISYFQNVLLQFTKFDIFTFLYYIIIFMLFIKINLMILFIIFILNINWWIKFRLRVSNRLWVITLNLISFLKLLNILFINIIPSCWYIAYYLFGSLFWYILAWNNFQFICFFYNV